MYQHHVTGNYGEQLAQTYLAEHGFTILGCNVQSRWAEIDIIAKQGEVIYFFEVKTRRTLRYGHPYAAVSRRKLIKIRNLAWLYVQRQHLSYRALSLGVVGVILQPEKVPVISHISYIDLLL